MALIALVAAAAFALQPVGSFHDGETVARDGERWLALRVTPTAAALVDTRVRVRRVHDAVVDADDARTGREVSSHVADAMMLLRGAGLRAGAVAMAAPPASPTRLGSTPVDLHLRRNHYRLALHCTTASRCDVVLADGRHRQVLFALDAGRYEDGSLMLGDDAAPVLLFAGDLDRDGRLDLILDTTDHYNLGQPTLFLSSPAPGADLVRRVASLSTVGC